jgi:hypothetical protein
MFIISGIFFVNVLYAPELVIFNSPLTKKIPDIINIIQRNLNNQFTKDVLWIMFIISGIFFVNGLLKITNSGAYNMIALLTPIDTICLLFIYWC